MVLTADVLQYFYEIVCGSWIRWLVGSTGSGADRLGGGWERDEVQRTAKHYDDAGHGKGVGFNLLLLCRCYYGGKSAYLYSPVLG